MSSAQIIGGNLVVTGNAGNDNIGVNAGTPAAVTVAVNGVQQSGSPFDMTAYPGWRAIIDCLDGINIVSVFGANPFEINGGAGTNYLTGGNGNDVIRGNGSTNTLTGGQGNDVLVGGPVKATLSGGAGKDVLVAAACNLSYDDLKAASDAWVATSDPNDPAIVALVAACTPASGNSVISCGTGGTLVVCKVTDQVVNFVSGRDAIIYV
jgi:Ca2+-binding RTX toxin-like protein